MFKRISSDIKSYKNVKMSSFLKATYEYIKLRKRFGKQTLFEAPPAHFIDSINSDKSLQDLYMLRNPVNRQVQATMPQSIHDCNTKRLIFHDTAVNHEEGGWPREVGYQNEEHTIRYRRRIMHEDDYIQAIMNTYPTFNHFLNQNNAIEMYKTYFSSMPEVEPLEKNRIKELNVFRDPARRTISSIVWTNENNPKLGVSYYSHEMGLNDYDNGYIWDIHRENEPVFGFETKDDIWQLASSPVDPEIFVGGMKNGTVNLYDIRKGSTAASSSSIYKSHRCSITGLLFIHSRTNTEFFSGSPDGQCLWWDLRNLSKPTDELPMSVRLAPKEIPSIENAEGVSSIQFERNLPTRFLCGTETGLVINGNRMGKTHSEILCSYWIAQQGPVRAVHRSPCIMRMFITCGDWTVRIWSEEFRNSPIIITKPYRYQVTDVAWAPQRYSSYMSICQGGFFYYWDLLRKFHEPMSTLKVSKYPLSKITPNADGSLISIGDDHGSLFLLQLSESMSISGSHDKARMSEIYERETRREQILDNRSKEQNLKRRQEEEALELQEEIEETEEEDSDAETEKKYFEIVNQQLEKMVVTIN